MSNVERIILHLGDWNDQDKYYEAPINLLKDLKKKILAIGIQKAWAWWVGHVGYSNNAEDAKKPIKYGRVDMTLETYFLDYNNPIESVNEWEIDA